MAMIRIIASALALVFSFVLPAAAVDAHHEAASKAASSSAALTDGEVRRVDKEARKLTIRHGPIQNLDMPPMTMVFQVQDVAMLESVKAGDKIKFSADKIDGAYTVTKIEAAK
jgi:Cu/Ag efflux protein CusF